MRRLLAFSVGLLALLVLLALGSDSSVAATAAHM